MMDFFRRLFLSLLCGLILIAGMAQSKNPAITVSGFVYDAQSGESLIGTTVVTEDSDVKGTVTDNSGFFSLSVILPATLRVSFVGYTPTVVNVSDNSHPIKINIEPAETTLEAVEISAEKFERETFNVSKLNIKQIENIPMLGGKTDIIKAAQLFPGIEATNEGSSLLIVRGGSPGENMYLFDRVPVTYVNHIGGFMSVFNPDIINGLNIYKGGFPAKYGGKLSSIVEITQKEGNKNEYKGSLSVGVTDLSFSVEGPGGLKNSSFIVTGRKTMIDFLFLGATAIAKKLEAQDFSLLYGFHDINAKYSWHPDPKNSFHINIYEGDDYMKHWVDQKYKEDKQKSSLTNIWGNILVSGSWNRVVSPKIFSSNTISYSRYRLKKTLSYKFTTPSDTMSFENQGKSILTDVSLRSDWKYSVCDKWKMEFGLNASYLQHQPNNYFSTVTDILYQEKVNAFETSVYFDNNLKLFSFLDADLGVRLVGYFTDGYYHLAAEPRANINFRLNKDHTLNLSLMRVNQNSHLLFTTGAIMNNEVWVPAGKEIPVAASDQISAGWKGYFAKDMFSAEVNVFYKNQYNLTTYKDGYNNLIGDGNWREKLVSGGRGNSMGVELMFSKNHGDFTGSIGYTLSRTTRQFDELNEGKEYLYEYDRPHSLTLNFNYRLNSKWNFNILWVYQTGAPYTPIIGQQYAPFVLADGTIIYDEVYVYGDRNSARMRDYHRLDLGARYSYINKKGRKAEWNFSVYNAYFRKNAYYYFYSDRHAEDWNPSGYNPTKLYLQWFFPIIPTASYKVYF